MARLAAPAKHHLIKHSLRVFLQMDLDHSNLTLEVRRSPRAKYMRLTMHADGVLVVTAPMRAAQEAVQDFIAKNRAWVEKTFLYFLKHPRRVVPKSSRREYVAHKEKARALVHERIAHFNQHYGFTVGKVAVRMQKSRWGSCSRAGNLNFNYKLVFLPPQLVDYIVVHELCHLKEFNHSPRFWALVAEVLPNHRALRKELRTGL